MSAATKTRYGTNSVSKFSSLQWLLQLRKDNYVSAAGYEHCPFEAEALINEKSNKLAGQELKAFINYEKALAHQLENNLQTDPPPAFKSEPIFKLQPAQPIKFNIIH